MTKEEHNILLENNKMLKLIILYINLKESNACRLQNDMQNFLINVIANKV